MEVFAAQAVKTPHQQLVPRTASQQGLFETWALEIGAHRLLANDKVAASHSQRVVLQSQALPIR